MVNFTKPIPGSLTKGYLPPILSLNENRPGIPVLSAFHVFVLSSFSNCRTLWRIRQL